MKISTLLDHPPSLRHLFGLGMLVDLRYFKHYGVCSSYDFTHMLLQA